MQKVLYVTFAINAPNNGANVVIQRNLSIINRVFGADRVLVKEIASPSVHSMLRSLVSFSSYGVLPRTERELIRTIKEEGIELVFVEGTLLGNVMKRIEAVHPAVRTVVFVHNIDRSLYRQQVLLSKSLLSFIKYKFVSYNEAKTFRYVDHIIVLNERDGKQLETIYGREADAVIPISCPEQRQRPSYALKVESKPYCLFVGSDFFPNNFGMKWFIRRVAPYIRLDVWVVGSCCRALAPWASSLPANVRLKGFVDDLEACYAGAECVVAPIFQGSGMKTKVIEALSYGKSIFGTEEALQGIEADRRLLGGECHTAEEFISALNTYSSGKYNSYASQVFDAKYSHAKIYTQFKSFFDGLFI